VADVTFSPAGPCQTPGLAPPRPGCETLRLSRRGGRRPTETKDRVWTTWQLLRWLSEHLREGHAHAWIGRPCDSAGAGSPDYCFAMSKEQSRARQTGQSRPIRSSARIALTRPLSDARRRGASLPLLPRICTMPRSRGPYTTPRAAQAWARSTNGAAGSASRQRSRSCACRLASRAAV
jgi:hypothetical protein